MVRSSLFMLHNDDTDIQHAQPAASAFVEVIGQVGADMSIQELTSTEFGDSFGPFIWNGLLSYHVRIDMGAYEKMVNLSQRYGQLFLA